MASKKKLSEGIAEDITGASVSRIALKRVTDKKAREKKFLEARSRIRFVDEKTDSTFGQNVPGSYNPYYSGVGAASVRSAKALGAAVDPNELENLHLESLKKMRRGEFGRRKPIKKPVRKPAHKTSTKKVKRRVR